jgi:hypothetical protein
MMRFRIVDRYASAISEYGLIPRTEGLFVDRRSEGRNSFVA